MVATAVSSIQGAGVIVTGSSSGIGRACAVTLAERGFTVFATVRKSADADALRALGLENLIPVCPLDLTKPEQIAAAIKVIQAHLRARKIGLYAIVNNAGGGGIAPIELMDVGGFRTELEARLVGPVTLLQALLPEIRQSHGRIVWIATPALLPIPFVASIHAADYAINCLARTLQIELKPWQIPSILIRCGGIQTASVGRSARDLVAAFEQWPADRFALYADRLKHEADDQSEFDSGRTDPGAVAQVVYSALTTRRPKRRYQIGHLSRVAAALEYLPQTWVDAIMERRG